MRGRLISIINTIRKNRTQRSSVKAQCIRRRYSGVTITEVAVASALLIVAMVPILRALTAAHLNSTIIERKTQSLALAQAKLDDIKVRSIYGYDTSYTTTNEILSGSYLCNVTDTGFGSDIRTMTVDVGFDNDGNSTLDASEISVTLNTLLAKRW